MSAHLLQLKQELVSGTAQLLDVRELDEWNEGHLTEAKLVPLSDLKEFKEPEGYDMNKKTYLHCRSGGRVQIAAPILEDMGFTEVIPLDEGFAELVSEGFVEV
jgi:rhodanese-related sulfurtransferase